MPTVIPLLELQCGDLCRLPPEKQMWQIYFKEKQQFTAELVLRSLSKGGSMYSRKPAKSGKRMSVALEQRVVRNWFR